jgi:hypothetical protein
MLYHNFGGEMMRTAIRCTGWRGGKCAIRKTREAWAFGIFTPSTWLCLLNKFGGWLQIMTPFVQLYSEQNTILMVTSFRQDLRRALLLHGKALLLGYLLLKEAISGGSAMGKALIFILTHGSHRVLTGALYVTTQDFIKFWGKFFAFVMLEMFGISQGFKTFRVYLKALFENLSQAFYHFLNSFFGKIKGFEILFSCPYSKPMQGSFA